MHFTAKTTMRPKELSKDLRDKVVERHRSCDGYKNISTSQSLRSGRLCGTTKTLPKSGWPSKLDDQTRRRLIRVHQEANGNFERVTCLYGKDWSLCVYVTTNPKHSTSLACTVGWQEGSHYSKKPTLSPI